MIKLIASDIDGTLVQDGDNTLNPEFYDEILRLRAKGIQFAVATGRQWHSIEQVFDPIKEKIFYISDNGAYVGCYGRNLFLGGSVLRRTGSDVKRAGCGISGNQKSGVCGLAGGQLSVPGETGAGSDESGRSVY